MTNEWKERVLQLAHRTTEAEDLDFVNLVELATGKCDLETCKVLMKTFVTDHDFGVQESVVSTLSSARTEDYQVALLCELPRLVGVAPEWADVLLEREIINHPNTLRASLKKISPMERDYLAELVAVKYPDFDLET